ncbi:unnamed protein product [Camellia sinensis]
MAEGRGGEGQRMMGDAESGGDATATRRDCGDDQAKEHEHNGSFAFPNHHHPCTRIQRLRFMI